MAWMASALPSLSRTIRSRLSRSSRSRVAAVWLAAAVNAPSLPAAGTHRVRQPERAHDELGPRGPGRSETKAQPVHGGDALEHYADGRHQLHRFRGRLHESIGELGSVGVQTRVRAEPVKLPELLEASRRQPLARGESSQVGSRHAPPRLLPVKRDEAPGRLAGAHAQIASRKV